MDGRMRVGGLGIGTSPSQQHPAANAQQQQQLRNSIMTPSNSATAADGGPHSARSSSVRARTGRHNSMSRISRQPPPQPGGGPGGPPGQPPPPPTSRSLYRHNSANSMVNSAASQHLGVVSELQHSRSQEPIMQQSAAVTGGPPGMPPPEPQGSQGAPAGVGPWGSATAAASHVDDDRGGQPGCHTGPAGSVNMPVSRNLGHGGRNHCGRKP